MEKCRESSAHGRMNLKNVTVPWLEWGELKARGLLRTEAVVPGHIFRNGVDLGCSFSCVASLLRELVWI